MEAESLFITLRERGVVHGEQRRVFPAGGCEFLQNIRAGESLREQAVKFRLKVRFAEGIRVEVLTTDYYPGNQDPHKSLQPIRSSNSRSRLPRDQRSTTESTEIHGKENPNQLSLSVSFRSTNVQNLRGVRRFPNA